MNHTMHIVVFLPACPAGRHYALFPAAALESAQEKVCFGG